MTPTHPVRSESVVRWLLAALAVLPVLCIAETRLARAQPIPMDERASTMREFREARQRFFTEQFLEPFDRIAPHEAPWYAQARRLVEESILDWSDLKDVSYFSMSRTGTKLFKEMGCDDPLVAYITGFAISENSRHHVDAEAYFKQALEGLKPAGYPVLCNVLVHRVYAPYLQGWKRETEAMAQRKANVADMLELARSTATDSAAQRHVFSLLRHEIDTSLPIELAESLRDQLKDPANGVDPWLRLALSGIYEVRRAWDERGAGWGYEVEPGQWKGFSEHLAYAARDLNAAYRLDPTRPEAAARMITVTMGGHPVEGLSTRDWFDRAVKAQFDYDNAYSYYLWSLRPRWGGSLEEMIDFGLACADTRRYETVVPLFLFLAMRDVCDDRHRLDVAHERYELWSDEDLYRRFLDTMSAMLGEKHTKKIEGTIKSAMILAAWRSGRYEDARRLVLDETELDAEVLDYFCARAPQVERECLAYSGPHADEFGKAKAAFDARKWAEAAEMYAALMEATEGEAEIARANRTRKPKPGELAPRDAGAIALAGAEVARIAGFAAHAMDEFERGQDVALNYIPQRGVWETLQGSVISSLKQGFVFRMRNLSVSTMCPIPAGQRLELDGTIDFSGAEKEKNVHLRVLLRDNLDVQYGFRNCVTFNFSDQQVELGRFLKADIAAPAAIGPKMTFRISLWDGWVEVLVDGKTTIVGQFMDDRFERPAGDYFGLNTSRYGYRGEIIVDDLRLRKLNSPPPVVEKAMADKRATDRDPGFR